MTLPMTRFPKTAFCASRPHGMRPSAWTLGAMLACAIPFAAGSAEAQQGRALGAYGPVVLRVDRDTGQPIVGPERQDLRAVRAVPVPTVMNGSGFGLSGVDYYSDGLHEGPLRTGRRTNDFILAPALRPERSR